MSYNEEEIMNMSREELLELLGEENASNLIKELNDGKMSLQDFTDFFRKIFPDSQQADVIQGAVFIKLTKTEVFNLFERDPNNQEQYSKVSELMEKVKNRRITENDLTRLCELAFPDNKKMARDVKKAFLEAGIVKRGKNGDDIEI